MHKSGTKPVGPERTRLRAGASNISNFTRRLDRHRTPGRPVPQPRGSSLWFVGQGGATLPLRGSVNYVLFGPDVPALRNLATTMDD